MSRRLLSAAGSVFLLIAVCRPAFADESAEVRASSDAFVAAFNAGDAKAVADLWTQDGELVDEAGQTFSGREAIAAAYAKFFQAHPGATIQVTIDSLRMLNDSAAIEEGHASVASDADETAGSAKYTAVHVKQDGNWRMAAVYEASPANASHATNLQDLDWLVGKWTAEERGGTMSVDCHWLANKTFLERKYSVTATDQSTTSGVQLIGLDPRTGQIISSGFNSDGSRTMGNWMPQQEGWAIDAIGQTADGADTHAINLLTKLDENAYAWQSVGRSAAGQALPDTGEIILKRSVTSTSPKAK
jgi:uncharacterized protein (TIGR02246 family)